MKCPLRMITRPGLMTSEAHPNDDCLKEECAWWIPTFECCAVWELAIALGSCGSALFYIEEKFGDLAKIMSVKG